jgi:hypothetical protein
LAAYTPTRIDEGKGITWRRKNLLPNTCVKIR